MTYHSKLSCSVPYAQVCCIQCCSALYSQIACTHVHKPLQVCASHSFNLYVCIRDTTTGHDTLQEYSGSWVVESDPSAHTTTLLKYEISLQPKLSIPSAIVTCVVKAGLPANMTAMAKRAEQVTSLPPFIVHTFGLYPSSLESSIQCHL